MSNLRVPFALVAGVLFSSAVFLALYQLVAVPLDVGPPLKATAIEFTRQIVEAPQENKRVPKIERPPPPVVAKPNEPNVIVETGGTGVTVFERAKIEFPPGRQTGGIGGTDRDVIPVVRVLPDYPVRDADARHRRLGADPVRDHGDGHGPRSRGRRRGTARRVRRRGAQSHRALALQPAHRRRRGGRARGFTNCDPVRAPEVAESTVSAALASTTTSAYRSNMAQTNPPFMSGVPELLVLRLLTTGRCTATKSSKPCVS